VGDGGRDGPCTAPSLPTSRDVGSGEGNGNWTGGGGLASASQATSADLGDGGSDGLCRAHSLATSADVGSGEGDGHWTAGGGSLAADPGTSPWLAKSTDLGDGGSDGLCRAHSLTSAYVGSGEGDGHCTTGGGRLAADPGTSPCLAMSADLGDGGSDGLCRAHSLTSAYVGSGEGDGHCTAGGGLGADPGTSPSLVKSADVGVGGSDGSCMVLSSAMFANVGSGEGVGPCMAPNTCRTDSVGSGEGSVSFTSHSLAACPHPGVGGCNGFCTAGSLAGASGLGDDGPCTAPP